jgi:hypothetical protein
MYTAASLLLLAQHAWQLAANLVALVLRCASAPVATSEVAPVAHVAGA